MNMNMFVWVSINLVLWFHIIRISFQSREFVLDYNSLFLLFYFMKSDLFLRIHNIVLRAFEISKK